MMNKFAAVIFVASILMGAIFFNSGCITKDYNVRTIHDTNRIYSEDPTMHWNDDSWVRTNVKYWSSASIIITNHENVFGDNTWLKETLDAGFRGQVFVEFNPELLVNNWALEDVGTFKRDFFDVWSSYEQEDVLLYTVFPQVSFEFRNLDIDPTGGIIGITKPSIWNNATFRSDMSTVFYNAFLQTDIDISDISNRISYGIMYPGHLYQAWQSESYLGGGEPDDGKPDDEDPIDPEDPDGLLMGLSSSASLGNFDPGDIGKALDQYTLTEYETVFNPVQDNIIATFAGANVDVIVAGDRLLNDDVTSSQMASKDIVGYFWQNANPTDIDNIIVQAATLRTAYAPNNEYDSLLLIAGVLNGVYNTNPTQYATMMNKIVNAGLYLTPGHDNDYFEYPSQPLADWWIRYDNDSNWQNDPNNPDFTTYGDGFRRVFNDRFEFIEPIYVSQWFTPPPADGSDPPDYEALASVDAVWGFANAYQSTEATLAYVDFVSNVRAFNPDWIPLIYTDVDGIPESWANGPPENMFTQIYDLWDNADAWAKDYNGNNIVSTLNTMVFGVLDSTLIKETVEIYLDAYEASPAGFNEYCGFGLDWLDLNFPDWICNDANGPCTQLIDFDEDGIPYVNDPDEQGLYQEYGRIFVRHWREELKRRDLANRPIVINGSLAKLDPYVENLVDGVFIDGYIRFYPATGLTQDAWETVFGYTDMFPNSMFDPPLVIYQAKSYSATEDSVTFMSEPIALSGHGAIQNTRAGDNLSAELLILPRRLPTPGAIVTGPTFLDGPSGLGIDTLVTVFENYTVKSLLNTTKSGPESRNPRPWGYIITDGPDTLSVGGLDYRGNPAFRQTLQPSWGTTGVVYHNYDLDDHGGTGDQDWTNGVPYSSLAELDAITLQPSSIEDARTPYSFYEDMVYNVRQSNEDFIHLAYMPAFAVIKQLDPPVNPTSFFKRYYLMVSNNDLWMRDTAGDTVEINDGTKWLINLGSPDMAKADSLAHFFADEWNKSTNSLDYTGIFLDYLDYPDYRDWVCNSGNCTDLIDMNQNGIAYSSEPSVEEALYQAFQERFLTQLRVYMEGLHGNDKVLIYVNGASFAVGSPWKALVDGGIIEVINQNIFPSDESEWTSIIDGTLLEGYSTDILSNPLLTLDIREYTADESWEIGQALGLISGLSVSAYGPQVGDGRNHSTPSNRFDLGEPLGIGSYFANVAGDTISRFFEDGYVKMVVDQVYPWKWIIYNSVEDSVYSVSDDWDVIYTPSPVAQFTVDILLGQAQVATFSFTDLSTNTPTEWLWDFGDGDDTDNTLQNPTHQYTTADTFTVALRSTNVGGSGYIQKVDYIITWDQIVADFTYGSTTGVIPYNIAFTDASTNNPDTWAWTFGDGNTSTEQNPIANYIVAGTYSVSLTASSYDGVNTDVETKTDLVIVGPAPTVDFSADPIVGVPPLDVSFTDLTTNSPDTWLWDFGDTETSPLQNPNHTYDNVGVYDVQLFSQNNVSFGIEVKQAYIDVGLAPVALFSADTTIVGIPYDVSFTDESTNVPTSWLWDFGDTGSSTEQNPIHTYTTVGPHTVTLQSTNAYGVDSEIKTDYIDAGEAPVAAFSGDDLLGPLSHSVTFTDASTNTPTSWLWNFGNGDTLQSPNPTYEYTSPGTYDVTLTVTNAYGSDVESKIDYISTDNAPIASYSASPLIGASSLQVTFTNTSTDASTYLWDFGDFNSSVTHSPVHTYSTAGDYTVTLTATSVYGNDDEVKVDYITVYDQIVAGFSSNVTSGVAPLSVDFTDESTNSPDTWLWDFGGGNFSSIQNPNFVFSSDGIFSISLTASNNAGENTSQKIETNFITVGSLPNADFTYSTPTGILPHNMIFTDTSINNPLTWQWDFGDGSSSTETNPSYQYTTVGTYTVSLTVTNSYGSNVETKTDLINVGDVPVADFVANVTSGSQPLTVNFTDLSAGVPTSWQWDFGNFDTSTEQNPQYTFNSPGVYTIQMFAQNDFGFDLHSKTDYITVGIPPVADFSSNVITGEVPFTVNFVDESTGGAPTLWEWDFGTCVEVAAGTSDGDTITFTGTGFGVKSPVAPALFDDFTDGTDGERVITNPNTVWTNDFPGGGWNWPYYSDSLSVDGPEYSMVSIHPHPWDQNGLSGLTFDYPPSLVGWLDAEVKLHSLATGGGNYSPTDFSTPNPRANNIKPMRFRFSGTGQDTSYYGSFNSLGYSDDEYGLLGGGWGNDNYNSIQDCGGSDVNVRWSEPRGYAYFAERWAHLQFGIDSRLQVQGVADDYLIYMVDCAVKAEGFQACVNAYYQDGWSQIIVGHQFTGTGTIGRGPADCECVDGDPLTARRGDGYLGDTWVGGGSYPAGGSGYWEECIDMDTQTDCTGYIDTIPPPALGYVEPTRGDAFSYWNYVYFDTTFQRIEIGDDANYYGCTKRSTQIPTAWVDNSVSFQIRTNGFTDGETAYVHLVDDYNVPTFIGSFDVGAGTPSACDDTSQTPNPNYEYTEAGFFDVTLTVTNAYGFDSITKTSYISSYDPPEPIQINSYDLNSIQANSSNIELVYDAEFNQNADVKVLYKTINTSYPDTSTVPWLGLSTSSIVDGTHITSLPWIVADADSSVEISWTVGSPAADYHVLEYRFTDMQGGVITTSSWNSVSSSIGGTDTTYHHVDARRGILEYRMWASNSSGELSSVALSQDALYNDCMDVIVKIHAQALSSGPDPVESVEDTILMVLRPAQNFAIVGVSTGANYDEGVTVTISGAAFGAKDQAGPILFEDFEAPTVGTGIGSVAGWVNTRPTKPGYISDANPSVGNQHLRITWFDPLVYGAQVTSLIEPILPSTFTNLYVDYDVSYVNSDPLWDTTKWSPISIADDNWISDVDGKKQSLNWFCGASSNTDVSFPVGALEAWAIRTGYAEPGSYSTFSVLDNYKNSWGHQQIYIKESTVDSLDGIIWTSLNEITPTINSSILSRVEESPYRYRHAYIGQLVQDDGFVDECGDWLIRTVDSLYIDFDEFFVDTTSQRVEIGNNANYNNCTKRVVQPATLWTDTSVEFPLRWGGDFTYDEQAYVFVTNQFNTQSTGWSITLGGQPDVTPPDTSNTFVAVSFDTINTSNVAVVLETQSVEAIQTWQQNKVNFDGVYSPVSETWAPVTAATSNITSISTGFSTTTLTGDTLYVQYQIRDTSLNASVWTPSPPVIKVPFVRRDPGSGNPFALKISGGSVATDDSSTIGGTDVAGEMGSYNWNETITDYVTGAHMEHGIIAFSDSTDSRVGTNFVSLQSTVIADSLLVLGPLNANRTQMVMINVQSLADSLVAWNATIDSAKLCWRYGNAAGDFSGADDWVSVVIPDVSWHGDWTDGDRTNNYDVSGQYAIEVGPPATTVWSSYFYGPTVSDMGPFKRYGEAWGPNSDNFFDLDVAGVQAWADGTAEAQIWIIPHGPTQAFVMYTEAIANPSGMPCIVVWGTK